jgi:hypothetical protein
MPSPLLAARAIGGPVHVQGDWEHILVDRYAPGEYAYAVKSRVAGKTIDKGWRRYARPMRNSAHTAMHNRYSVLLPRRPEHVLRKALRGSSTKPTSPELEVFQKPE